MKEFIEDKIGDLFIPKNLGNSVIQNVPIERDFLGKKTMAETGIKIPATIPEVINQPGSCTNTESYNNNEIVKWVIGGLIIAGILYVGYQYYKKREERQPKYKVL